MLHAPASQFSRARLDSSCWARLRARPEHSAGAQRFASVRYAGVFSAAAASAAMLGTARIPTFFSFSRRAMKVSPRFCRACAASHRQFQTGRAPTTAHRSASHDPSEKSTIVTTPPSSINCCVRSLRCSSRRAFSMRSAALLASSAFASIFSSRTNASNLCPSPACLGSRLRPVQPTSFVFRSETSSLR